MLGYASSLVKRSLSFLSSSIIFFFFFLSLPIYPEEFIVLLYIRLLE